MKPLDRNVNKIGCKKRKGPNFSLKEKKWWLNCSKIVLLHFKELVKMITGQNLYFH